MGPAQKTNTYCNKLKYLACFKQSNKRNSEYFENIRCNQIKRWIKQRRHYSQGSIWYSRARCSLQTSDCKLYSVVYSKLEAFVFCLKKRKLDRNKHLREPDPSIRNNKRRCCETSDQGFANCKSWLFWRSLWNSTSWCRRKQRSIR